MNFKNKKDHYHWRSFISFMLFLCFFWISITGVIIWIAPPGRMAHWINWTFLGFSKDDWQSQHTIFSYLFFVFCIFHIFSINWRVFFSYLTSKLRMGMNKKREAIFAILLFAFIFVVTVFRVPPFGSIVDFGDETGKKWGQNQTEAPLPRTDKLTLEQTAKFVFNMPVKDFIAILKEEKIEIEHKEQTFASMSEQNGMSPVAMYNRLLQHIRKKKSENKRPKN